MAKNLIIIESPGKISKFSQYLGKDYVVKATIGHLFDLPEKKLGIDLKKDFTTEFVLDTDKKHVIQEILNEAKKSERIFIATDSDREGSAIGHFVYSYLIQNGIPKNKIRRAKTNSITKPEILKAIENACDISEEKDLVEAFLARRITDRICGYKTSYGVKQATGGASAGRTQSSGLRILSKLEKEILDFIPIIYWPVEAELLTKSKEKILASIKEPKALEISTKSEVEKIISTFKKGPIKVSKYEIKTASVKPYPPFTTSSLQQAGSSYLGFSPDKTMSVAQSLYQAGKITYHRSDSTNIVTPFISAIRTHIENNFDKKYLPEKQNYYVSKVKNAQEAHEAVRVTDLNDEKCGMGIDENKLYQLIYKRTIASQMSNAEYERRSAEFSCDKYILSANGSKELFDGFRKVWDFSSSEDKYLPDLKVGDIVDGISFTTEEKQTSPPSRYSESSFVKALEDLGIGRPSTFASIIKTLKDRKYIETKGKAITVTELGLKVDEFLVKSNFCFIDLGFTSNLEDKLDEISNGKINKTTVLTEFWERLKSDIENSKKIKNDNSITDYDCKKCDGKLLKKFSKWGPFYACDKCKTIYNIADDGSPVEKIQAEKIESEINCPNCGEKLLVKTSKKGNTYLSCRNWKDVPCSGFYDLKGVKMDFSKKKKFYKKKKE